MGASPNDFEEHFASLSDHALMEIHRDDLVDAAKAVYDHEMTKRGLVAEDADEPEGPAVSSGEQLVNVVEFESPADAAEAQAKLKKAGIPAYLAIAVPEAFARQAVSLLDPGVSDDELEALADAAGEDH